MATRERAIDGANGTETVAVARALQAPHNWTANASRARDANLEAVFLHDGFNFDGGTVARLGNGHFLVGLTQVASSRAWNPAGSMLIFEVTDAGEVVGLMRVPKPTQTNGAGFGGYRALPWQSVGGESETSPFGPG